MADTQKSVFESVRPEIDFPRDEAKILSFWKQRDIFRKTLEATKDSPRGNFVVYEGPPTANGMPHNGHGPSLEVIQDLFSPLPDHAGGYQCGPPKGGWGKPPGLAPPSGGEQGGWRIGEKAASKGEGSNRLPKRSERGSPTLPGGTSPKRFGRTGREPTRFPKTQKGGGAKGFFSGGALPEKKGGGGSREKNPPPRTPRRYGEKQGDPPLLTPTCEAPCVV